MKKGPAAGSRELLAAAEHLEREGEFVRSNLSIIRALHAVTDHDIFATRDAMGLLGPHLCDGFVPSIVHWPDFCTADQIVLLASLIAYSEGAPTK